MICEGTNTKYSFFPVRKNGWMTRQISLCEILSRYSTFFCRKVNVRQNCMQTATARSERKRGIEIERQKGERVEVKVVYNSYTTEIILTAV